MTSTTATRPFAAENAAFLEHHAAHVAHALAVHHDGFHGHGIFHAYAVFKKSDGLSVFNDLDVVVRHAALFGKARVQGEVAVFAVGRE